jgi:hypothetical protein
MGSKGRWVGGSASQAGDVAAELGEHFLRVKAELLQEVGVLVGVDLVGQLLLGLVGPVGVALLVQDLEDLVFGDLNGVSFRCS